MEDKRTKRPRDEMFLAIDSEVAERLRLRRIQTKRPVCRIVEEILAEHFDVHMAESPSAG
jgi:hypothetical protein